MGETRETLPMDDERRVASSNVFKITKLGSSFDTFAPLSPLRLRLMGLMSADRWNSPEDLGFVLSVLSSAYSGRVEKLSGTTTTWYVPGLVASAFLSRSSSVVSSAKGGSESSPKQK